MKGVDEYKNNFIRLIDNKIKKNDNIPYLREFKSELISEKANDWSGKYNYICRVVNFMIEIDKTPGELMHIDFIEYLSNMAQNNKSASYRMQTYAALKRWCRCLEKYCPEYDKTQSITSEDAPKYEQSAMSVEDLKEKKNGYLTKREVKKYMDNVRNSKTGKRVCKRNKERDEAIISLFLTTGMRCASLYQLDVNNIDWEDNAIYFMNKGGHYKRIPLSESTKECLRVWIEKRKEYLGDKAETEEALFVSNRKRRITRDAIADIVHKYGYNIKNKNLAPHKLRHTVGTNLYNKTGNIGLVADFLGHKNINTTRIYIDDMSEHQQKASEFLDSMID